MTNSNKSGDTFRLIAIFIQIHIFDITMQFKGFTQKIFIGLVTVSFMACGNNKNTDPERSLSEQEQADLKYSIARYIHKLPNRATEANKFEAQFDEYYTTKSKYATLDHYYKGSGDTVFFQVSKIAPSMKVKKVATAGKLLRDGAGNITYYEEVYRTWKMEEPELKKKSERLFGLFIAGKDLTPYYTENSTEEYIEFPDRNNSYDTEKRMWVQFQ